MNKALAQMLSSVNSPSPSEAKVWASYNQAEYLDDRQLMLQHCADFFDEI